MSRVLVALSLVLFSGCTGFAADANLPPPPPQAPAYVRTVAPFYDWTGVYFGGHAGYGFARAEATVVGPGTTVTEDMRGVVAGGQLGGNMQFGWLVIGAEIDGAWSDQKNTTTAFGVTVVDRVSWFSTARLRFGLAFDRIHVFGSLGGGALELTRSASIFVAGAPSGSKTYPVVAAGIGIEGAVLPNLILRAEYLMLTTFPQDQTVLGIIVRTQAVDSIVRAAISYKFGGGYGGYVRAGY